MDFKNMKFKMFTGCDRGLCKAGCGRQDRQLNTYDYLADVPGNDQSTDLVEVQFKNTRKGYYHNVNNLELSKGDIVAVEANPGHDIGVVTLTGRLVELQVKKANLKSPDDIRRIYRHARQVDMEKYHQAKAREHDTMIESRQIAKRLGLQMKIGDVEYQGDGNKAIFYYIADERVDFRQLIKDLAAAFHVRNAARLQDLSLNPTKLAGMCAKLKCCMNYEADTYMEAGRKLPGRDVVLQTMDGDYFLFKKDILAGQLTYSTAKGVPANLEVISAERAHEVIEMNRRGEKPDTLQEESMRKAPKKPIDLLADADISRFDKAKRKKKNKQRQANNNRQQGAPKGHAQEKGNRPAPKPNRQGPKRAEQKNE